MSSQIDYNSIIHSNKIEPQSGLLVDPVIEDNVNLYILYNMLVKQGMKKKQVCDHLKVKPGTIDSIRKNFNLKSAHYFGRREKPKKKNQEYNKANELIERTNGTSGIKQVKRKPKKVVQKKQWKN